VAQPVRPKKSEKPRISTAVILNRSPILTKAPTPFETAFYSYQARIRRALSNPFPHDFYFKQGSLLQTRFNLEERQREKRAFGPSFLPPEDVDPEKAAADKAAVEQLAQQEGEGEELTSRTHKADSTNDVKSLDRQGQRNLYLLLLAEENGKDVWRFPQGGLEKGDLLHQVCDDKLLFGMNANHKWLQAAQKDLFAECGEHMDTWIVGRNPIGLYKPKPTPNQPQVRFAILHRTSRGY
jgi:large subunit ribosomal protein L46